MKVEPKVPLEAVPHLLQEMTVRIQPRNLVLIFDRHEFEQIVCHHLPHFQVNRASGNHATAIALSVGCILVLSQIGDTTGEL